MDYFVFLRETLNEIDHKLSNSSTYNLIRISGLLRQLLCDQHNLIDLAQKGANKKFLFRVNADSIKDAVQFHSTIGPLDEITLFAGGLNNHAEKRDIVLDEYIKIPVIFSRGHYFTIRDVIKYIADKRGGVHLDKQLKEQQILIDDLSKHFYIGGVESLIRQVFDIAENVIDSAIASEYYEKIDPSLQYEKPEIIPQMFRQIQESLDNTGSIVIRMKGLPINGAIHRIIPLLRRGNNILKLYIDKDRKMKFYIETNEIKHLLEAGGIEDIFTLDRYHLLSVSWSKEYLGIQIDGRVVAEMKTRNNQQNM